MHANIYANERKAILKVDVGKLPVCEKCCHKLLCGRAKNITPILTIDFCKRIVYCSCFEAHYP